MYRADNDRSLKAEEHNLHTYNSKSYIAELIIDCNMAFID